MYISGDFNLNLLNQDKTIYESIEAATGLKPKISEVTRAQSNSCIDNVLTNLIGTHRVSVINIADHKGLHSMVKTTIKKLKPKKFSYREMKESNWINFANEVRKLAITGVSTNEKWSNLCKDIKSVVEKSFPLRQSKNHYNFVMSQGLLKSKNKKINF